MITAGIDVGLEYTKAVVMKDGKITGKASGLSGGLNRPKAVQEVYDKALAAAGVKSGDVEKVFATGKGKFDAGFAGERITELFAAAKAARMAASGATMVVSIGADEIVTATLDAEKVKEFVINEKCAAGLGVFLDGMANRLDMSIEDLGKLEGESKAKVNDGCVVFAELDALSLLNRGTDAKEVAKALIEACAWRANSVINDIYKADKAKVVLMGGLALNKAFLKALEKISGLKFVVHEDPFYGGAIGAAALAAG